MCKLITNTYEGNQQVLIINRRFTKLQQSLNQVMDRYIKYTNQHFYSAYNDVKDTQTGIITDNLFDPVPDILMELICETHKEIANVNKQDMQYSIKSAIHRVENLFHGMQVHFKKHQNSSNRSHLKSINDAKFFRLIQRRINGARRKLLNLSCNSQQFGRTHHA